MFVIFLVFFVFLSLTHTIHLMFRFQKIIILCGFILINFF